MRRPAGAWEVLQGPALGSPCRVLGPHLSPPPRRASHCGSSVQGAPGGRWRNARSRWPGESACALTLPPPPCSQSRWRSRSTPLPNTSTGAGPGPAWAPYRLVPLPRRLPAFQLPCPPRRCTTVACKYAAAAPARPQLPAPPPPPPAPAEAHTDDAPPACWMPTPTPPC